jgi:hypothetical protein
LMKALLNVGIAMQALHGQRDNKEEKSSIFWDKKVKFSLCLLN